MNNVGIRSLMNNSLNFRKEGYAHERSTKNAKKEKTVLEQKKIIKILIQLIAMLCLIVMMKVTLKALKEI